MGNVTVIGLVLLAAVLFWLAHIGWLGKDTLERLAQVAGIVALIAAVLVFVIPAPRDIESQVATPTQPPESGFEYISLDSVSTYNDRMPDLDLPLGINVFSGIPFDIGQKANTQCDYFSEGPRNLNVNVAISDVKAVYFLMAGTAVQKVFLDKEVGIITLHFSNNQSLSIQLIAGRNIRNWAINRSEYDLTEVDDSNIQQVWQSRVYLDGEDRTVIGIWDRLTIEVPKDLEASILESISIVDTSHETVGQLNPCIYIVAVTVEYEVD